MSGRTEAEWRDRLMEKGTPCYHPGVPRSHAFKVSTVCAHMLIVRQDPEVCPDSQRVYGHDDDDDDDDDRDDDDQYAPHKQCI